jgi:hypothetical protein
LCSLFWAKESEASRRANGITTATIRIFIIGSPFVLVIITRGNVLAVNNVQPRMLRVVN